MPVHWLTMFAMSASSTTGPVPPSAAFSAVSSAALSAMIASIFAFSSTSLSRRLPAFSNSCDGTCVSSCADYRHDVMPEHAGRLHTTALCLLATFSHNVAADGMSAPLRA
jgi:hypothetical protein